MKVSVIGCSTTWSDRPTSSYCINDNILVDAGEGTLKYYKQAGVDFKKIEHIFVTHLHSDHTFAIINYIYNIIGCYRNGQKRVINIYGTKGITQYLKALQDVILPDSKNIDTSEFIRIHEITDFNEKIKVDDIEVSVFELKHGQIEDIAYVFDDNKATVGFSGDCTYTQNLDKFVKSANILYLECCGLKTSASHLGYDKYIEYVKENKDKIFYAVHCIDDVYYNADNLGICVAKAGQVNYY